MSTELLDPLRWVFYVLLSVQLVSFVVKCHAILNNLNNAIIDRQLPSSCNGGWLIDMCNITLYIVGCYLWIKHVIEMEDFELKSFHDEEINPTQSQNKSLDHLFDEIHMQQLFLVRPKKKNREVQHCCEKKGSYKKKRRVGHESANHAATKTGEPGKCSGSIFRPAGILIACVDCTAVS